MLSVNTASKRAEKPIPEPLKSKDGEAVPIPVPLPLIVCIAKDCLELPADLRPYQERCRLRKSLSELVCDRYSDSKVPELHPIKDMHGDEPGLKMAAQELELLRGKLEENTVYQTEQKNWWDQNGDANQSDDAASPAHLALERADLQAKIAQSQLSDFKSQVKMRRKVLRKLGHLTADGLLTSKGKAAAEVQIRHFCDFLVLRPRYTRHSCRFLLRSGHQYMHTPIWAAVALAHLRVVKTDEPYRFRHVWYVSAVRTSVLRGVGADRYRRRADGHRIDVQRSLEDPGHPSVGGTAVMHGAVQREECQGRGCRAAAPLTRRSC